MMTILSNNLYCKAEYVFTLIRTILSNNLYSKAEFFFFKQYVFRFLLVDKLIIAQTIDGLNYYYKIVPLIELIENSKDVMTS